ncbi:MAG: tRNA (guanosine(46)-N7)-methyltransferase TrmB [Bacteroidetes bacterium]|nr:tRNA (guanosine(46)-N7)-methyltransferase TrmB [Bacteroidota bacterium]
MGQKKLIRFAELKSFQNVLEFPKDASGNWSTIFENNNPITLELACGKGEYALGLGELFPDRNFIGVDIKGNRIWVGARKALQQSLSNVRFLRAQIERLADFFAPQEVNEIWITFPDPQLRFSKAKKRLTHPRFLRLYQKILVPGGLIHLKTDSPALYSFTCLVAEHYQCNIHAKSEDVYGQEIVPPSLSIKTHYESLDIAGSNRIYYCSFSLPASLGTEITDQSFKDKLAQHEGL